jgi:hypothetical protein
MTECIYPNGNSRTNGYALMYYPPKKKSIKAHRAAWMLANGPVPAGMVVDHICHNKAVANEECQGGFDCSHRACINIKHLQLVTQSQNVMSGIHNIDNRSHCNQGHPFIKENIMVRKNGKRECAECNRERAKKNYALKKVGA